MSLSDLNRDLDSINAQIKTLIDKRNRLSKYKRMLAALEFIRVNKIKRSDIEMSNSDDKPYFGHIDAFISYIRSQKSYKRFAEWNTVIYFTSDLLNGKMPYMPATILDLEE